MRYHEIFNFLYLNYVKPMVSFTNYLIGMIGMIGMSSRTAQRAPRHDTIQATLCWLDQLASILRNDSGRGPRQRKHIGISFSSKKGTWSESLSHILPLLGTVSPCCPVVGFLALGRPLEATGETESSSAKTHSILQFCLWKMVRFI